jgi:D-alanine-D-alanine ligase-like ATP-grasp enzyme
MEQQCIMTRDRRIGAAQRRAEADATLHLVFPVLPTDSTTEIFQTYRHGRAGFEQELPALCAQLGFQPVVHHIDLNGFADVLDAIPAGEPIFYLCDGNEDDDGVCGLTPILYMERRGRPMITAGSTFWRNTTYKFLMKRLFMLKGVPTPAYRHVTTVKELPAVLDLNFPLFAKPDALYGSVGISDRSVLWSAEEVHGQLPALLEAYGSLLVEEFVEGPEFTAVVLADGEVFATAERRFDLSLPSWQRFISYHRSQSGRGVSYTYAAIGDEAVGLELNRVAVAAFRAVRGDQYARIDVRRQTSSGELLVLEVNAMPGIGMESAVKECARVCGKNRFDLLRRVLL